MKWIFGLVVWLSAQTALAAECQTYTSELWEPGERTVQFLDDGSAVIRDQDGERRYGTAGAGTGIPGRAMLPIDGPAEDGMGYIEHKGDVIIDNEVFTPYCRIQ